MKNKNTVAILDQDIEFAEKFKQQFNNNGFNSHVIHNCEGIRESLKSIKPSLIICDINFANGTTDCLIDELRSDKFYNLVPIVVLTDVNLDGEQIDKILITGVSGLFFKPLKFEKFLKSVTQILNKQKNHEAVESSLDFIRFPFKVINNFIYWLIFKKSY